VLDAAVGLWEEQEEEEALEAAEGAVVSQFTLPSLMI
jgi:hypothetical protein